MKRHQRNIAASLPDASEYDYLRDEAATRLLGRLEDIKREFPDVLDLGCHTGNIVTKWSGQGGFRRVTMLDGATKMLERDQATWLKRTDRACFPLLAALLPIPPYDDLSALPPQLRSLASARTRKHPYPFLTRLSTLWHPPSRCTG